MASGKRYRENLEKIDSNLNYSLDDAVEILKKASAPKFDETIDISINLGVDPRHADQLVRGTISMPNGTGKDVSILVLAKGDLVDAALEAGADFAGSDEYLEKIKSGWTDVDSIIATPEMMPELGKLGRVLGPRGLMPNPKTGTVTNDVAKAVQEIKAGKIEYKVDKNGILHVGVAKMSFDSEKIIENVTVFINAIKKAKPSAVKGVYMKKVTLSSTMGPGIKIDYEKVL
tara:strand:+ start:1033 stop:1722 length:690 start_codon:yes stop_codon:yes gene_type:complete